MSLRKTAGIVTLAAASFFSGTAPAATDAEKNAVLDAQPVSAQVEIDLKDTKNPKISGSVSMNSAAPDLGTCISETAMVAVLSAGDRTIVSATCAEKANKKEIKFNCAVYRNPMAALALLGARMNAQESEYMIPSSVVQYLCQEESGKPLGVIPASTVRTSYTPMISVN